mmetsp:Transcript_26492/g.84841  ORF Transcript_26492/g.84841 Transcript_26492/m.84841 type:complete len:118 (-) Transcript_26492:126-479(-)
MSRPHVLWSEKEDKIYISVEVKNAQGNPDISIGEEGTVSVKAAGSDGTDYKLDLRLFDGLIKSDSKVGVNPQGIVFQLKKKEDRYWDQIQPAHDPVPPNTMKMNWDTWWAHVTGKIS